MRCSIYVAAVSFGVFCLLATAAHAIQVKNGASFVFYDSLEGDPGIVGTDAALTGRVPPVGLPWTQDPSFSSDAETTRIIRNSPTPANHGENFLEINRPGPFGEPDPATANFTPQTSGILTSEFAFRIRQFGPGNENDAQAVMYGNGNSDLIGGMRITQTEVRLVENGAFTPLVPAVNITDNDWHTALFTYDIAGNSVSLSIDGGSATAGTPANNVGADAWQFRGVATPTIVDYDAVGPSPIPPDPNRIWNFNGSGDWNVGDNWNPEVVPNDTNHTATFGSVISQGQTVFTNTDVTVNSITFDSPHTYAIAGIGSVTLESHTNGTAPSLTVTGGTAAAAHQFQAIVNLRNDTTVNVGSSSVLTFNNALNLGGASLTKTGAGTVEVNNVLTTGGGTINILEGTVSGHGTIGGDVNVDGGTISPGGSSGVQAATSIPEPSTILLLILGFVAIGGFSLLRYPKRKR